MNTVVMVLIVMILASLAIYIAGPLVVALLALLRAAVLDIRDAIKKRRAIKGRLGCEWRGWEGQYPNRQRIGCLNKATHRVESGVYLCEEHTKKRPFHGVRFQTPVSMLGKSSKKVVKR